MPRNAVMKHMLTIYTFALFPVSTTVRNLSSSIVQRFIGTNSRKKFISRLVPVAARESPLKLNKIWFRGSFFKKPKLCFSLWHARRNSSCSNDWSCSNLTKGPPYSRRVSLGDVTAYGKVQDWPSRERLRTRLNWDYFKFSWLAFQILQDPLAATFPWKRFLTATFFLNLARNGYLNKVYFYISWWNCYHLPF